MSRSIESEDVDSRPRRILLIALLGAVLLWLAQPPVGCWPLAYVGAGCWLSLAARAETFGRREYVRIWLGGVAYWLLTVHWIRLPHPLTPLGWPLLAMFLALYALTTIALVRLAIRRWNTPLWAAGPVAWTALELVQARLFTGFLMGAVSHSHAGQPWIRSIAAYAGAYGVTFAIIFVAATLVTATRQRSVHSIVRCLAAVVMVFCLGEFSRRSMLLKPLARPTRVALVQGDSRVTWDPDPGRSQRIMDRHVELTVKACQAARLRGEPIDVCVWPESMFRAPIMSIDGQVLNPRIAGNLRPQVQEAVRRTADWFRLLADSLGGASVVVGLDRFDSPSAEASPETMGVYNSVALADGSGEVLAVYDKTHLVPFGEYIPFASGVPALYYLTPITGGLRSGEGPVCLPVPRADGGVLRLCPTICYETVVPHVVRRHVADLTNHSARPDALVNVTNDAWFWGSSELDMHLACSVFRAVENGLPLLIAANGGLSAIVSATGEVVTLSGRMQEEVVVGEVPARTTKPTFYTTWGDLFAGVCLLLCSMVLIEALIALRRQPTSSC